LTLFEVDEAATRIREEADQDANIIVGAIFDESLEGIVRVSVVATGIDNTGVAHQIQRAESALTELAGNLRTDSRHTADRIKPNATQPHIEHPPLRPIARLFGRPAELVSKYARQAAPRGLDACSLSSAMPNSVEEEVLDIPAFLPARPTEPTPKAARFEAA
jgi:cell division protein FtsZ